MNTSDFPNYYQASDQASIDMQRKYLCIIKIDLFAMIFAAALAIYNYQTETSNLIFYIISGILLLVSLIASIILKTKKYEDYWYQGRALAESCKTLTWRFVCCSEYFEQNIDTTEVKRRFSERIRELSNEFRDLSLIMNARILNRHIITDKMLEIRGLSLQERKSYYIQNRIENQKTWYSDKAQYNIEKYNNWFVAIIISQILSIIGVIFLIKYPLSSWNVVGLFTTISASGLSWLQVKKHQELKQAYTTAAQELNFILSLSDEIDTENAFSKFVLDSENAISREHTLWLAQKRIITA